MTLPLKPKRIKHYTYGTIVRAHCSFVSLYFFKVSFDTIFRVTWLKNKGRYFIVEKQFILELDKCE